MLQPQTPNSKPQPLLIIYLRCRANLEQIRQSRPDSGLGFQVKVLERYKFSPLRSEAEGKRPRCLNRADFAPEHCLVRAGSIPEKALIGPAVVGVSSPQTAGPFWDFTAALDLTSNNPFKKGFLASEIHYKNALLLLI